MPFGFSGIAALVICPSAADNRQMLTSGLLSQMLWRAITLAEVEPATAPSATPGVSPSSTTAPAAEPGAALLPSASAEVNPSAAVSEPVQVPPAAQPVQVAPSSPTTSNPADPPKNPPEMPPSYATRLGIGAVVGSTSGIAFVVRRHFAKRWGVQGGGLIFAGDDRLWWNLAAQGMYTMYRGRHARFYGLFGAAVHHVIAKEYDFVAQDVAESRKTRDTLVIFGPGFGLELHAGKHFSWHVELPLTVWIDAQGTNLPLGGSFNVLPVPNTGVVFYF